MRSRTLRPPRQSEKRAPPSSAGKSRLPGPPDFMRISRVRMGISRKASRPALSACPANGGGARWSRLLRCSLQALAALSAEISRAAAAAV